MSTGNSDNVQYSPDTVAGGLAHLRASESAHVQLGQSAVSADEGRMYSPDLVLMGVVQRSLSLIDAFVMLVEASNPSAAIPMLRMQLDNALRFYACWVAADYNDVLTALLQGDPLNKVKSSDGKGLSDAYLVERASERWPWMRSVYKATCGFVHLSTPGLLSGLVGIGTDEDRKVYFHIGMKAGRPWPDKEKKEAVDVMVHATDALLQLVASWGITKERAAKRASG